MEKRSYLHWTQKETEMLKKVCEENFTIKQIMEVFPDRSKESITNKLYKMGLALGLPHGSINFDAFREIMKSMGKVTTL